MSQERYSRGYRSHIRTEKRRVRENPTWEGTYQLLQDQFRYSQEQTQKLVQNSSILKEFYEARLEISQGLGSEKLNKFIDDYDRDPKSKAYNPQLISELSPFFVRIRDRLK